ncbi:glycerate kinase [Galbitalea sp. SE-J8]|uniref:glycerate kinase n=1 Tax=Galbitalea sp. SE-J8 TaxID=3054952 RepID=UPI00259D29A5|nr:glycerate kinase [Galbitalea sp. SE-J8]MDM4763954.1 glycerate kinase [Galbitalea sp. SE-J8]
MRIVVAPDSFKGTIGATDAASAIADGWRRVRPDDVLELLPQADGGEGTLDAVRAAVPAAVLRRGPAVTGPDGRPVPSTWLALPDGTALVELAAVSGLPLLREPDSLGATTRGLGETIAAALDDGATALWIALGGSASTDGGAGALSALGLRITDAAGDELPDGGGALARVARVDRSGLRAAPAGGIRLLSDVRSPLLGPRGAAAVFGPQKGATPQQVRVLDAGLARFASRLGPGADAPGAGAAGGTGYGFIAAWGAEPRSGADAVAELTGLPAAIERADLVITGEGRADATSLEGKVVGRVLERAVASGTPALVIAGAGALDPHPSIALVEIAGSVEAALADPARWLRAAGQRAAGQRAAGQRAAEAAPDRASRLR